MSLPRVVLSVAIAIAMAARPTSAQPVTPPGQAATTLAIEYIAPAECPDEISVKAGVIARLGRDPFHGEAPRRAFVDVQQTAAGFVAAIELREPGREPSRRVVGPAVKCEDAVAALELALAVIVDPTASGPTTPAPPSQPTVPTAPTIYEPPGWRAAQQPMGPPASELAISFGSFAGSHPDPAFSLALRAGYLGISGWRIGVIARHGQSNGRLDDDTRKHTTRSSELVVEGCWRRSVVLACALAGIGQKSVDVVRDEPLVYEAEAGYSDPYALLGVGAGLDIPLGRGFLRPAVDLTLPLPRVPIESLGVSRADLAPVQLAYDLALGYRW